MRIVWRLCFAFTLLSWQARTDTIRLDAGADPGQSSSLGSSPQGGGCPSRLTQYDLPASTAYYVPVGAPHSKKAVNLSRPLTNGYPPGWKLLFFPAVISQSNKRW